MAGKHRSKSGKHAAASNAGGKHRATAVRSHRAGGKHRRSK